MSLDWFQIGPIPADAIKGSYNFGLVFLSYVIAVLASYAALDLAGRLRAEKEIKTKRYWLVGGAFAMGAGIWSMHFIGMLAFKISHEYYDLFWTFGSLIAAFIASAFALFLLRTEDRSTTYLILGGILLGLGICTMHYMGMQAMKSHLNLHYLPGLFFLSVVIAIVASEVALWLMIKSNRGAWRRQIQLKLMSALIMGAAICGMHYTGMAATIFTPLSSAPMTVFAIEPNVLAFYVAGITTLIIVLALTLSTYKQLLSSKIQNEKLFLDAILNNLNDGIIACDSQGRVNVFNHAIQKILQLPPNTQYPQVMCDYCHLYEGDSKEPVEEKERPLLRALRGERFRQKAYEAVLLNDDKRNMLIDGQPIKGENNETMGAVITIHDITDRMQMERRLVQSEKMAAIGQMATGIAHELNQPLSIIRTDMQTMELLSNTNLSKQDITEMVARAVKQVDRAAEIISRMRTLVKQVLPEEGAVNLLSTMEMILEKFRKKFEKNNISFSYSCDSELSTVKLHVQQIEQLTKNLLDNSEVAINAAKNKAAPDAKFEIIINLKRARSKNEIIFEVIDNGIGMEAETLAHCLEPFFTTQPVGQGTGLGLTACYNIVKSLNGEIDIKSELNRGTTVTVRLPMGD